MSASVVGRLPTIPEYYRDFINKSVDLNADPKQCCPFHNEDTPSFSYSLEKGVWRCFGGCHCGGNVIDLHKKNYKLKTKKEAEESLYTLYKVDKRTIINNSTAYLEYVNDERVEEETLYQEVLMRADTVERWLQLDYVMSIYPLEWFRLRELLESWK